MSDLRLATPDDAPAMASLVQAAYRDAAPESSWTTEAELVRGERISAEELVGLMGVGTVRLLVLDGDAGGLLACCQLEDRGAGLAHFGTFAVRPGAQGAGTGRRVLGGAEAVAAAELGAGTLELQVLEVRDELIGWYERLGFVRTGERRAFPRPELLKVPNLRFTVLAKPL